MHKLILTGLLGSLLIVSWANAEPVRIVAAENFYGDIARQIGGPDVAVTSILSNPDQDPHLFELSPAVGRDVSAARVIIYNGIGYDPWMTKLVRAIRPAGRQTIVVADLVGRRLGDNPHIWYDPATMLALGRALKNALMDADPGHKTGYSKRWARFEQSMRPIRAKVEVLRPRLAGTPVTATEPLCNYLFEALGVKIRNPAFQHAVMNNTEPSPSEIADFERDLKTHKVKLLLYNRQATSPISRRMASIARASGVPVLGAAELEPPGMNYQDWMMGVLDATDRALAGR